MSCLKKMAVLLAFGLSAINANASVTYAWVPTSDTQLPSKVTMSITFSDDVVNSGSVNYMLPQCNSVNGTCLGSADSAVQGFTFRTSSSQDLIFFSPATEIPDSSNHLRLNVKGSFNGDFFTGVIDAAGLYAQLMVSGSEITDFRSEGALGGCYLNQNACNGATGNFVRVPEPGSLALFGLGTTAFFARRRKHKHAV